MPLYCYHSPATGSNYLYHSVHSFSSAVVGMVVPNDETDKEWNGMMAQPFLCEEEVINICLPFENRQPNNKMPISSFHNSLTLRWADGWIRYNFIPIASVSTFLRLCWWNMKRKMPWIWNSKILMKVLLSKHRPVSCHSISAIIRRQLLTSRC